MCTFVRIYPMGVCIYTIAKHEQGVRKGSFLSGVSIQRFHSLRLFAIPSSRSQSAQYDWMDNCWFIISFPNVLMLCEMQIASSYICFLFSDSNSNDHHRYTKFASKFAGVFSLIDKSHCVFSITDSIAF